MRAHEIPVATGEAALPDTAQLVNGTPITGWTIPLETTVNMTWNVPRQKTTVGNNTGSDICLVIDGHGCTADNGLVLVDKQTLVIGEGRPHLISKLSIYALAEAIYHGAGKNCTIQGWPVAVS